MSDQSATPPTPPVPPEGEGAPFDVGSEWLRNDGVCNDVVLSSRVRLARNLARRPFSPKATRRDRQEILDLCRAAIMDQSSRGRLIWVDLHTSPPLDRALLVERHLISKQHSKGKGTNPNDDPRGVAISVPGERLSIMVNEEDHLRIQTMRSGLALAEAWEEINGKDDEIEAQLDFAFSPKFGYLSTCPTNLGTGLRMSAMLHLPGLRLTGEIEKVKRAATDMGLAVRGFYGEGSEAVGDLFQVSNQTTLGKSEEQVLHELEKEILPKIVEYERLSRRELLSKRRIGLEDQVWRAWGLLTSARLLTTEEAMQGLSLVRLGAVLGVLPPVRTTSPSGPSPKLANQLMLLVQPAHLQRSVGRELDQEQRRVARASLVRSRLTRAN
ncbi:MAG TPA: protein arginine kinase [Phycisphaerales bacterium]|nr:protein arginine kinase [Phycisphaerales bacterium]